jgi:hypothetical protein
MIGVRLALPAPLRHDVHLSAAQLADMLIAENTEVATVRTESMLAIVHDRARLTIRAPS